jgi:hypothetical protein
MKIFEKKKNIIQHMASYTKYEVMKLCKICKAIQDMNRYTKYEATPNVKRFQ